MEVLGARAGHRCVLVVGRVVSQSKSIITIQTKRYKNQTTTYEGDQERFPLFLRRTCEISTGRKWKKHSRQSEDNEHEH